MLRTPVKHDRQGRPSVKMPERNKPADDLPHLMAALHIAGFFRAVGSALDCLGGAIIGVLALPASILKADIDKAMSSLDRVKNPVTDGERVQIAFRTELATPYCDRWTGGLGAVGDGPPKHARSSGTTPSTLSPREARRGPARGRQQPRCAGLEPCDSSPKTRGFLTSKHSLQLARQCSPRIPRSRSRVSRAVRLH